MSALGVEDVVVHASHLAASARRLIRVWHVQVLLVFAGSRVVSTLLVLAAIRFADPSSLGWHRSLLEALTTWDGGWYQAIARTGYPVVLPMTGGHVQGNAWAFMPLYPLLITVLGLGNSALFPSSAVIVSTACGAGAALALAALVRPRVGTRAAVVTAAIFALGPAAYLLQAGYAESTGLLLLFLLLLAVDRGRYGRAALVAVPLAFARPGMQAVALLVVLHLAGRLWTTRRDRIPLHARDWLPPASLAVLAAASGFAWPAIAGWVTGVRDAYLLTELSWRAASGLDSEHLTYFTPWVHGAILFFGRAAGPVVLFDVVLAAIAALFLPAVRRTGSTVRAWYLSYALYLAAVFFPQSSTLRLCLPLAPVTAPLGRLPGWQVALLLAACTSLQGLLVWNAFGAPMSIVSVP